MDGRQLVMAGQRVNLPSPPDTYHAPRNSRPYQDLISEGTLRRGGVRLTSHELVKTSLHLIDLVKLDRDLTAEGNPQKGTVSGW